MPNIGPLELAIVLVIALVIFGPKRLPDLGRSLGSGMREFKDSITGKDDEEKTLEETKAQLTEQSPATTAAVDDQKPEDERVEADVVSDPRA
jgi:sec-independent protein translocase protein TatA